MSWTDNANHRIYYRTSLLATAGIISIISIIGVLVYLQICTSGTYISQGIQNFTRYELISSPRGNIVDCTGRSLATNRPIITLYWRGTEQVQWSQQQMQLLRLLEDMYMTPLCDNLELRHAERTGRSYKIAEDISLETLSMISDKFQHTPNILVETEFQRHYPLRWQAAHIIGHINTMQQGQMGIERLCNTQLSGYPGYRQKQITATGKTLGQHDIMPPTHGATIHATIDIDIQRCAENAFLQQEHNGTIICLDSENGDIKALVSRPSFDPNTFTERIDTHTWQTWQHNFALLNRACNAVYPPASIFKLITAATALEEQLISPQSTWYCSGATHFARRTYACNRHTGHAGVTITDAIAHSCNIPFYEIGKELDIDTLAEYAERLGLNHQTGVPLPENTGLIPTQEWKECNLGERWWQGETLSATIGQSYVLVTPIQIARMINAICQGYLVRPRILTNEPIHITPLDISPDTQACLQNAMRTVVTHGRARDIGAIEQQRDNLTLYAKTGTAQTSHKVRRKDGAQFLEHGWFVVHVRYADHRPITLVVLLEHIGSSRIAGHTARNFLTAYCDLCDQKTGQLS